MKKICKIVKFAVIATAIGETIASYQKDEKFRENLSNAKGLDKLKIVFSNLVEVNKNFFEQAKQIDYKWKYEQAKQVVWEKVENISSVLWEKLDILNEKVDFYKEKALDLKKEKLDPVLEELSEKAENLKKQIEEKVDNVKEKVKFEEKLEKVKKEINEIKEKFSKKD